MLAAVTLLAVAGTGWHVSLALLAEHPTQPIKASDLQNQNTAARHTRETLEAELRELRREEDDDEPEALPPQLDLPVDPPPPRAHSATGGSAVNPFIPQLPPPAVQPQPAAPAGDHAAADRLDARGYKFAAVGLAGADATAELSHCKAVVERTLSVLPANLTAPLDTLTLYLNARQPRGLSNSHVLELSCGGLTDREIVAVLVHELGHIADLGAFRGVAPQPSGFVDGALAVAADDLSAKFYGISWTSSTQRRFSAARADFVSGYAMTDPFEDFAESFITYVLHGDDFRQLARSNAALAKKYNFLRDRVFAGAEYSGAISEIAGGKRVWDVTLVDYDLAKFWRGQLASATTRRVGQ